MQRIKEFISNNKKLLAAIGVFLLLALIYFFEISGGLSSPPQTSPFQVETRPLVVANVYPPNGVVQQTYNQFEAISFKFSEPIKPGSVIFSVSPNIKVKVSHNPQDPTSVNFYPDPFGWAYDTKYTLTVTQATSVTGARLEGIITHTLEIRQPPMDNLVFPQ